MIDKKDYSEILGQSYIDYSMSVITSRAVPDIRDGFKPVHRRILYAMDKLGAHSSLPHKKSARISGEVMGKYHPHGDSYDTSVVMAQNFKRPITFIDGHGNFGSLEGDPPAASRYTEERLSQYSEDVFLEGLKYDEVDYQPNYDETLKEPVVLPCKLPNFLINGSEGIAVGMTTNTPSHNLSEVINGCIHYLDNSRCSIEDLMKHILGPDFTTGGIITNTEELSQIYTTGEGRLRLRGKIEFEKGKPGQKDKLVITEIPYTMIGEGINKFMCDVASLIEDKVLDGIYDIINQSSGNSVRIVLELKPSANISKIEDVLYKKTRLEDTFGVHMLAIHDGRPEMMNLLSIMKCWKEFQYETYTRRYNNLLASSKTQLEILEGLISAIDKIDVIVDVLKHSKNEKQAKDILMSGNLEDMKLKNSTFSKVASTFRFTDIQAQAILDMKLSRLIKLELDSLLSQLGSKKEEVKEYESILSDETKLIACIKTNLKKIQKKYGYERRTQLGPNTLLKNISVTQNQKVNVLLDYDGKICLKSRKNENTLECNTDDMLCLFSSDGTMFTLSVESITVNKTSVDKLINSYDSKVNGSFIGIANMKQSGQLVFITRLGYIKRVDMKWFQTKRNSLKSTILREEDHLLAVIPYIEDKTLSFRSSSNKVLKILQKDITEKGKESFGSIGMKLQNGESIESISTYESLYNIQVSKPGNTGRSIK